MESYSPAPAYPSRSSPARPACRHLGFQGLGIRDGVIQPRAHVPLQVLACAPGKPSFRFQGSGLSRLPLDSQLVVYYIKSSCALHHVSAHLTEPAGCTCSRRQVHREPGVACFWNAGLPCAMSEAYRLGQLRQLSPNTMQRWPSTC